MTIVPDSKARRRIVGALGASALGAIATPAAAQARAEYPSRPIRIIVTFAAGSATDIMTRHLAARMSQTLGQNLVIENRVGAAGAIGAEQVARATPDGYTIAMSAVSAMAIAPAIRGSAMPYDNLRDFTHIGRACTATNVVAVHPSVPASTLPELIAWSRTVAGGVRYSSGGHGGSNHLAGELIALRTGAPFVHVPYSNQGQAVSDAVAGHVPMIIYTVALLPHIRSGRLKAIAVTSEVRQKQLPDIGTAIEQGVPGIVANSWFGMVGPAGIPDPIRDRLYTALAEALSQPDIQSKLIDTGLQPDPLPAQTFRSFIERDTQTWREVAKAAGIKAE
jgi:tripartite-type tricarboxylate transporter receptor subunit TctC